MAAAETRRSGRALLAAAATLLLLLLQLPRQAMCLSRSDFPPGFLFGAATSAYQIEGAYLDDNKGLSNWDVYTHEPGTIRDDSNGDVAADHYHRFQEDVELMQSLGINAYRFSISWARVLPRGRFGGINPAGIAFYNNLIDSLIQKDIQPFATLHHFDLPYELEERYSSFLSDEFRKDFEYFAQVCFEAFGDRVKHWTTFNEPNLLIKFMYMTGRYPPNRCSQPYGHCAQGNSSTEPYTAMHTIILSHAAAVRLYKEKYQAEQEGVIGIVVAMTWYEPLRNNKEDLIAAQRALSFNAGWTLDPIFFAEYPNIMRELLGSNLPMFTTQDHSLLQHKPDFIGINHYTSIYIQDCISSTCQFKEYDWNAQVITTGERDGVLIGEQTGIPGYYSVPGGMEKVVMYVATRYNTTIIITENGYSAPANASTLSDDAVLNDTSRINFLEGYLNSLLSAIRRGAEVRGYFVWSLMDNFEWRFGYTLKFGLYHVEFKTQMRTPRQSARWFKAFLQGPTIREVIDLDSTLTRSTV